MPKRAKLVVMGCVGVGNNSYYERGVEWCGGGVRLEKFLGEIDARLGLLEDMGGRFVLCCVVTGRYGSSRDVVLERTCRNEVVMMMMIVTTIQDTLFLPHFRHISHCKSSDCSIYISLYRFAYLTLHSLVFPTRAYKQHIISQSSRQRTSQSRNQQVN